MKPFRVKDPTGDELSVRAGDGGAIVEVNAEGVFVLPHQVPGTCLALYEAAGLPVPDLPPALDEAEVQALAEVLLASRNPDRIVPAPRPSPWMLADARAVLLAGWKRSES